MKKLNQETLDTLLFRHGSQDVFFRFDLLNNKDEKKDELYDVMSGKVAFSSLSEIKATANFRMRNEKKIEREIRLRKLHELPSMLREW